MEELQVYHNKQEEGGIMAIIQSFIFSVCKAKLGLYEQRILSRIVEYAQSSLRGEAPKVQKKRIMPRDPNEKIELAVASVLDDNNDHYNHVYNAARSLMSKRFEYYDTRDRTWHASPIIYNARFTKGSGILSFYVAQCLLEAILDFSKGYREFSLETALSLPSSAAVRMYVLMCGQSTPLKMKVDTLKEMFGVANKYGQTGDFVKKIIDPAKKALDDAGVHSFKYRKLTEKGLEPLRGQKVTHIMFYPIVRQLEAEKDVNPDNRLSKDYVSVSLYLKQFCEFTSRDIAVATKTILRYSKIPGAVEQLRTIEHWSHRAKKPKGYIVEAMKKETTAYFKTLRQQE